MTDTHIVGTGFISPTANVGGNRPSVSVLEDDGKVLNYL